MFSRTALRRTFMRGRPVPRVMRGIVGRMQSGGGYFCGMLLAGVDDERQGCNESKGNAFHERAGS